MGTQKQDFMQMMMDSTDENAEKICVVEVVENIICLILGGYESTSNVMTWAVYYLARYPSVLNKLKEEIHGITNRKSKDELLTPEDIKEMKYTSKVTDELICLSNVSPFSFRRVVKDNVILNDKYEKKKKTCMKHHKPKCHDLFNIRCVLYLVPILKYF
ncbi:beta-amyrin 11-oxidase-like [Magnolia sinica]|uniref:beta-amyrin 11-oxidase-like n=1 Tax=Magnolia sinica TaxID=86752 RepID=UPI002658E43A|nr:beta-amyrin 11-oxidase-like [Magnolia sinica]